MYIYIYMLYVIQCYICYYVIYVKYDIIQCYYICYTMLYIYIYNLDKASEKKRNICYLK